MPELKFECYFGPQIKKYKLKMNNLSKYKWTVDGPWKSSFEISKGNSPVLLYGLKIMSIKISYFKNVIVGVTIGCCILV